MKILALDSSGLVASVAVVEDDELLAEFTINYKKTHSQTLLPMLDEAAKMLELDLNTVDAIAVAGGPGSFTGLRIGAATAKGLGLALQKPLIQIPTLDGLAYNLYRTEQWICPLMDARRGQTYTAIYSWEQGVFQVKREQCAVPVQEILEELNQSAEGVIFLGDGVPVFQGIIEEMMKIPYCFAPAHMSRQRAGALAALAEQYWKAGRLLTAEEFQPEYLRLSQAERERAERLKGKE